MASSGVIKNIFTFANILSQAGTEVVIQWDESSLRNAFSWAKYCEKVEEETRDKSIQQELDRKVRGLTVFLVPVCLVDLSLGKLKYASNLLRKRLLQNQETPLAVVKQMSEVLGDPKVISEYRDYRKGQCLPHSFSRYLAVDATCCEGALAVFDTGQLVLDTLLGLCHLYTDAKQHRFIKFVSKLTCDLLDEENGMEILGYVLLASVRGENQHKAAECVKGRILKALVTQTSLSSSVLRCDQQLLCQLSDRDDRFLQFYINQLLSWGGAMVPNYMVTGDGSLYSWQCSGDSRQSQVFSFKNLLSHLTTLLSYNRLRSVVEPALLERRGDSFFSVWKDLLNGVNERSE